MWHGCARPAARSHRNDMLVCFCADDGILEEAAGAAEDGGIGQFALPDPQNHAPHLHRMSGRSVREGRLQRAVVQARAGRFRQAEEHAHHDHATLQRRVLEGRIAIAIAALRNRQRLNTPPLQIETLDLREDILHFRAVRADVLHRRGSDFAGNAGQVLRAPEIVVGGPGAEIIEGHARTDFDQHFLLSRSDESVVLDVGMQHRPGEIPREEQVAPCADVQDRLRQRVQIQFRQIFRTVVLNPAGAPHIHPERVAPCQIVVILPADHRRFLNIQIYTISVSLGKCPLL